MKPPRSRRQLAGMNGGTQFMKQAPGTSANRSHFTPWQGILAARKLLCLVASLVASKVACKPVGTVACLLLCATSMALSQSIQPVIVEYTGSADGKFEVTNDTFTPMAVILEPHSFSINPDGMGVFRSLDADIHLTLSTTSFRLEPKESHLVFYKAHSDSLPAWFTVYAAFAPIGGGDGIKVRVKLPHTVYLYQSKPISKESIHVGDAAYLSGKDAVVCELSNNGPYLVRVQEVRAVAGKTSVSAAGFPLLPGASRRVTVEWKDKNRPQYILLQFPHFDLKQMVPDKDP